MTGIYPPIIGRETSLIVCFDILSVEVAISWIGKLVEMTHDSTKISEGFMSAFALELITNKDLYSSLHLGDVPLVVISSMKYDHENLYLLGGVAARIDPSSLYYVTENPGVLASRMLGDITRPKAMLGNLVSEIASKI